MRFHSLRKCTFTYRIHLGQNVYTCVVSNKGVLISFIWCVVKYKNTNVTAVVIDLSSMTSKNDKFVFLALRLFHQINMQIPFYT